MHFYFRANFGSAAIQIGRGGRVRPDGRGSDQMRTLKITPDFISTAEGSVLIELGKTRVICTATVNDGVPGFLKGAGKGWVTSEYGMLPRATEERTAREAARGKQSGRTQEIQRLIGRSLRAITDQEALGERTVWLDCDVIEADCIYYRSVRGVCTGDGAIGGGGNFKEFSTD